MALKNGDFLKLEYTQSVDGQVVATTYEDVARASGIYDEEGVYGPRVIILGSGQLVKGMEEELTGKEVGCSGTVEIIPEKAYGVRTTEKLEFIPANKFKDEPPHPGMRVSVDGKMGTVTRLIGRKVSVDFNHPLADKTVKYDYNIVELIEDREAKLREMIKAFAPVDLEFELSEDVAKIYVLWELGYYKEWLMIRRGLADMILHTLGLKEVLFIERHTGEHVSSQMVTLHKDEGIEASPSAQEQGEEETS